MKNLIETLEKYYEDGLLYKQTHPSLPLTIWNYSVSVQYENSWDEITLQCRGLVTDNEGNIVARPFKKFFNMDEGKHTPTSEFEVYDKMDGSLGIVFWYEGQWIVATRGSFTSSQSIKGKEIFDRYVKKYGDDNLNIHLTYLVEILFPENRIVVDYGNDEKLVLLGITDQYGETHHSHFEYLWFHKDLIVKKYDGINDYSILKDMIKDNKEGFVIKFSNGDRMKIKGKEYLRLHKIMTNVSTTGIWEMLSNGDDVNELLKDVPDEFYKKIKDYVRDLRYGFFQISERAGKLHDVFRYGKYGDHEVEPTKKEFAEFVLKQEKVLHPVMFAMWDKKNYNKIIWSILKPEFSKL